MFQEVGGPQGQVRSGSALGSPKPLNDMTIIGQIASLRNYIGVLARMAGDLTKTAEQLAGEMPPQPEKEKAGNPRPSGVAGEIADCNAELDRLLYRIGQSWGHINNHIG